MFCPRLGVAVGCRRLPTASAGLAAPRGQLCLPRGRGAGHPPQPRGGGGCQALAGNASFINPSAEEGGRNCHNNSDNRLI